ncbi:primosomal protein N' [Parvularcula sp. IMCC14364]|uniref:primosomal protein N' n=1 Tax=Parvularcula sp. IMCC14364 TaxID=3067902 RepID=UPI0027410897|nr:primosomal protein N' [Parvularcula sp. IMCC14364]
MNNAPSLPGLITDNQATVQVLLPLPLASTYTYAVPTEVKVVPGSFVTVPLGPREMRGVVWPGDPPQIIDRKKLKAMLAVFDVPPLSHDVMQFVDWVAAYTLFAPGAVLRMVMRSGSYLSAPRPQTGFMLGEVTDDLKVTPQREKVLAAARGLNFPVSASELASRSGVSDAVVRTLARTGALRRLETDPDQPFEEPDFRRKGYDLSASQEAAAAEIRTHIKAQSYAGVLLDGVTGAGKTEVYLEAVAAALQQDRTAQVLVLLPEIALTMPFLKRLAQRFGASPAHWHSDIGDAGRRRVWRRVADGSARLVVGARSALFLPFRNLKLIIVDEEHEGAYKQNEGVLYQARDMAVARAAQGNFPVVLASATPSLETAVNVSLGRYRSVKLESRFGGASMPDISLIDMREAPPERGEWLSPALIQAVTENTARGDQSLLFLNRRGYAPLTICRKCGERLTAPGSDTWLVEHRFTNMLVCHHTGFSMPKPERCPYCSSKDSLAACGPGVERIAEEAVAKWPDARIAVFSSDTVQSNSAAQELLAKMAAREVDILVATQIAAKGHHFPHLTLVGVVDADLGLAGGDLRAGERTWQVLSQVAGRAGRAEKPGRALLQTYQPEHPVIAGMVTGDRDAFMAAEQEGREMLGFPPFGRLAALLLTGENETRLNEVARDLVNAVPQAHGVEVWGPAPAPLYRLRGTYRIRFLVKASRDVSIQNFIRAWTGGVKIPSAVRQTIDIDPYYFL